MRSNESYVRQFSPGRRMISAASDAVEINRGLNIIVYWHTLTNLLVSVIHILQLRDIKA